MPRQNVRIMQGMSARRKRVLFRTISAGRVIMLRITRWPESRSMTYSLQFWRMYGITQVVMWGCAVLMVAGCSGSAPVLYPNAHLKSVGKASMEDDISGCRDRAEGAGASHGAGKGGKVATNTAVGAGAGAASGAVGGAISGGVGMSPYRRRIWSGIWICSRTVQCGRLATEPGLCQFRESLSRRKGV